MKAKKQPHNGVTPHLLLVENEKRTAKKGIQKRDSWILKRQGNKITAKDGNVLFVCPLCATHGKQLFFNSQHDLDLHIMRFHTGYPKGG